MQYVNGDHFTPEKRPSKRNEIQWHQETANHTHTHTHVLPIFILQQLVFSGSCKFSSMLNLVK